MKTGFIRKAISTALIVGVVLAGTSITAAAATTNIQVDGITLTGENIRKESVPHTKWNYDKQNYETVQSDIYVADGPISMDQGDTGLFSMNMYLLDSNLQQTQNYYTDWNRWPPYPSTLAYPGLYLISYNGTPMMKGIYLLVKDSGNNDNMLLRSSDYSISSKYVENTGDFNDASFYSVGETTIRIENPVLSVMVYDTNDNSVDIPINLTVNDISNDAEFYAMLEQLEQERTSKYYDGKGTITLKKQSTYYIRLENPTTGMIKSVSVTVHNDMPKGSTQEHPLRLGDIKNAETTTHTPTNVTTATPTDNKVVLNGKPISFDAYTIDGHNYMKLRDVAMALNGTTRQLEVSWDNSKNAINLLSNKPYTATGSELAMSDRTKKIAEISRFKVYLDGNEVNLTAYTINGNSYYELRDLGKVIGFYVGWDGMGQPTQLLLILTEVIQNRTLQYQGTCHKCVAGVIYAN